VGDSPALTRRRLRFALRRAREAAGLTQDEVGKKLEWSRSKVNRIEAGEVGVSATDLEALVRLFEIADAELVSRMRLDARALRRRSKWDDPALRENLTVAMRQFLDYEEDASEIRMFHPTVFPAIFQIRQYAEAIFDFWQQELSPPVQKARLEARFGRHILSGQAPPDCYVILDESVLFRQVGGPRVMVDQLNAVLKIAERPNVRVRILQITDATLFAMLGSFTILTIRDDDDAILYREGFNDDQLVEWGDEIRRHRQYFENMWAQTLDEEASRRLIAAQAAVVLASLDRPSPRR
jgi:transcriptional regulator with XRE-family HTH domain